MNQIAVIYWSGTGNTLSMAEAIAQGAQDGGADVTLLSVGETSASAACLRKTGPRLPLHGRRGAGRIGI